MSDSPDAVLLIERGTGFVTLTLNRPDRLNAFNEALHHAFYQALSDARDDEVTRAIVITGSGRGFCAGQDLSERDPDIGDTPPDLGHTIETFYNPLIRLVRSIPKPVICAVNGVAAGAGANIAFACDFILAAQSAKFIESFCKLGLIPDAGGSYNITRRIGEARAKYFTMTGEPLRASQAEQWGLITKVTTDDALLDEALALARHFAQAPTYGLGLTKQLIHESHHQSLDAHLDRERDCQRLAGTSPDYAEGVRAFLQKRDPTFTGKPPK